MKTGAQTGEGMSDCGLEGCTIQDNHEHASVLPRTGLGEDIRQLYDRVARLETQLREVTTRLDALAKRGTDKGAT